MWHASASSQASIRGAAIPPSAAGQVTAPRIRISQPAETSTWPPPPDHSTAEITDSELFGDMSSLHFGDLVLLVMAENGEMLFADAELDDRLFAQVLLASVAITFV